MNQITISDNKVDLITYKEQPVVTFEIIDKTHNRSKGTAKRNFNKNQKYLIQGEDYYLVDFSQKYVFRTFGIDIPPRGLIVLTKMGYLMLAKSFRDDLAWRVQRELVEKYFTIPSKNTDIDSDGLINFAKKQTKLLELFNINPKLTAVALDNAIKQKFGVSLLKDTWGIMLPSNEHEKTEQQLDVEQLSLDLKMGEDKVEQYLKHLNVSPTEEYETAFMVIKEYIRMNVHCGNPLL